MLYFSAEVYIYIKKDPAVFFPFADTGSYDIRQSEKEKVSCYFFFLLAFAKEYFFSSHFFLFPP